MNHRSTTWNDGAAGVTSYPILPRGNFTSLFNTTGDWGLKWYLDHVSTPSVDGNVGTIWIHPSFERERPYKLVSSSQQDVQDMIDAEKAPANVVMYNYQHREMPGLLAQLQKEGYDPYCFQSVLINGIESLTTKKTQTDPRQARDECTASLRKSIVSQERTSIATAASINRLVLWAIQIASHRTEITR